MEAAERIFEGKFDNVKDEDDDVQMAAGSSTPNKRPRMAVCLTSTSTFARADALADAG